MYIYIIIPQKKLQIAEKIAATFSKTDGVGMFPIRLSESEEEPTTHFACSLFLEKTEKPDRISAAVDSIGGKVYIQGVTVIGKMKNEEGEEFDRVCMNFQEALASEKLVLIQKKSDTV